MTWTQYTRRNWLLFATIGLLAIVEGTNLAGYYGTAVIFSIASVIMATCYARYQYIPTRRDIQRKRMRGESQIEFGILLTALALGIVCTLVAIGTQVRSMYLEPLTKTPNDAHPVGGATCRSSRSSAQSP